ncbi:MAG: Hsp20/alpha crystallin family protein [Synergistaceae bacterium]|nr:Hsp20/alpha crystallin family protein [Synergistaceae bacterium]
MFALTPYGKRFSRAFNNRSTGEIDELFDRLFSSSSVAGTRNLRDFDLYEKDGCLFLSMEAPGVNPDDLDVVIKKDSVAIRSKIESREGGTSPDAAEHDDGRTWYSRKSAHVFNYEISLPFEVDTERAEAAFENGVISISAPRLQLSESRILQLKKGS